MVKNVLSAFRAQAGPIGLIRKARLEYMYLDFLNENFVSVFGREYPEKNPYAPYLYAGMLFNVSMRWMADGFITSEDELARMMVNAIYGKDKTE